MVQEGQMVNRQIRMVNGEWRQIGKSLAKMKVLHDIELFVVMLIVKRQT